MLGDLIVALSVVFAPTDKYPWSGVWDLGPDRDYLMLHAVAKPTDVEAIVSNIDATAIVLGTPVQMVFCRRSEFESKGTCAPYGESVPCRMMQEGLLCEEDNPLPYRAQIRALNEGHILYSFQSIFTHGISEGRRVSHELPPFASNKNPDSN